MTMEEKLDKLKQYVKTLAAEHNKLEKRVEELEAAAQSSVMKVNEEIAE